MVESVINLWIVVDFVVEIKILVESVIKGMIMVEFEFEVDIVIVVESVLGVVNMVDIDVDFDIEAVFTISVGIVVGIKLEVEIVYVVILIEFDVWIGAGIDITAVNAIAVGVRAANKIVMWQVMGSRDRVWACWVLDMGLVCQ